ncbi:helix-turn-helix transcriptional regulator [Polaribacter tangerinus]|uniref:helix-turn-helix transcriptional regulator n=1 Tax=Polaribacter tangerinus TaxID=1920034 RepID=UPI000B4B2193|nr:hypothetical protein [Polaribacter tangerinus]
MKRIKLLSPIFGLLLCLNSVLLSAQITTVTQQLKDGNTSYKAGNYAESIVSYQKAVEITAQLSASYPKKDSLLLFSLKKLITVAGIGKAKEVSFKYYNNYKKIIFKDLCFSDHIALKIGIINNYIAISLYNKSYKEAIQAYEEFKVVTENCSGFRPVDLVQSSANAAMAYAKANNLPKAIALLPQLHYFKDSLYNWTTADYNKVLGFVKDNTNEQPEVVVAHYLTAAKLYSDNKNYSYALNLYENVLKNYSNYMTMEEIKKVVSDSEKVRDSTKYFHNDLYRKMMSQLGKIMLEKTSVTEKNTQLKTNLLYTIIVASILLILLLFYLLKKDKMAKNYYKQLYEVQKKLEIQQQKLKSVKNKFIKSNYILQTNAKPEISLKLFQELDKDFPNLKYNIHQWQKDLSHREIQIIYCIILGLSTKESAEVLTMTSGSFRVAKNRFIKKVGCNSAEALHDIVRKFL